MPETPPPDAPDSVHPPSASPDSIPECVAHALPPGSGTRFPALRGDVVARLHAYRREMMRRALLLLVVFVVVVGGLFALGWWLFTHVPQGWGHYAYLVGFGVFLLGMTAGFLWLVYFAPLEKFGLRCGSCGTSLLEMEAECLIRKGVCGQCGARLIRDAPEAEGMEGPVISVEAERMPPEGGAS